MSNDAFETLPSRPLTRNDVRSLASQPAIGICAPTYQFADEPDRIISLFLEINAETHVLVFDPDAQRWEVVESIETPDSLTKETGIDGEAVQRQLEQYYDEREIALVDRLQENDSIMMTFAGNFPQEPLTVGQIRAIDSWEFIVGATPFVVQNSDSRIISLFLAFDHPNKERRIVGSYGYNPGTETWQLITTVATADGEDAFETLGEQTDEWLFDRYTRDAVSLAEETLPT